ncbi:MAG TPA: biotin/lipoyl-containing protein [Thermoanaerobaculia bacterium]|nr:biotin/lipoyl-containing protein [Thermoanaerobaculia bacterium]
MAAELVKIACGTESLDVRLEEETALLGDRRVSFRTRRLDGRLVAIEIEGRIVPVRSARVGNALRIWCSGRVFEVQESSSLAARARETGNLVSPMPGRVRKVEVAAGDRVERGQVVMIVEAMKMEHAIRAPRKGIVAAVRFNQGDLVDAGVELVEIE